MKPKTNRLRVNWLDRRKIAVFKSLFSWVAMDGRSDLNEYNDCGFSTHAEAIEYAFRLAEGEEA
ncbi:hypothetical protein AB0E44_09320 [Micrococcus terreus]|uniref:hypothetical protein n=1 Tax=Micrococcus terreus TaxID=574650 RepID=UPI00340B4878